MSGRRVLATSLAALLMPASLVIATEASSASDDTTVTTSARQAKQRVKLQALPQIVQQGKGEASANSAKAGITATIKPAKVGRPAQLQKKSGSKWRTVSKARQNSKGRFEFAAKASKNGKPIDYRVVGLPYKGLGKVTSKSVSTQRWLTPSWTDEFSGSTLGAHWSHRATEYSPESLRACSKASPAAVKVGGGAVHLSVMKDPARSDKCVAKKDGRSTGSYAYRVNGHIGAEGNVSIRYGFAAARIKMHKRRGQHGGFWMQPAESVAGATNPKLSGAEIDVIEYFGDKHPQGGLTSFIYSKNSKGQDVKTGSWIKNPTSFLKNRRDGWSKNYHVFSVEWTPRMYVFRIDGKETWRTKVGVSGQPEFPILSLLASDYEISQLGGDSRLPQTMHVDWIRLWQA